MSSKNQDQLRSYPQDAQSRDPFFSAPNYESFKILF